MGGGLSGGTRILLALPPLILGGVLAASSEFAVGLLLYSGEGMVRALSVMLAVFLGSLGLGLWSGSEAERTIADALRHRWAFLLLAYVLAAAYALGWSFLGDRASRALSQGVGLAVLGALPLYAGGGLLAAMARESLRRGGSPVTPFALAAAGGALGVLGVGATVGTRIIPPSFLLYCLVLLSGASLLEAVGLSSLRRGEGGP